MIFKKIQRLAKNPLVASHCDPLVWGIMMYSRDIQFDSKVI